MSAEHPDEKILYVACLTFIPILYYLTIPFWLIPGVKPKFQYWAGLFIYIVFGPAMRTVVIIYTVLHMRDFSWGKTRMVVADDGPVVESKTEAPEPMAASPAPQQEVAQPRAAADVGDEEKRIGL